MKKKPDNQISIENSRYSVQYDSKNKNKISKLLLKTLAHKHTASYLPAKLQKVENNIFPEYNYKNINITNNTNSQGISLYNNNIVSKKKDTEIYSYKRRSSLNPTMKNSYLKQNFLTNNFNILNLLKMNPKKKNNKNSVSFLPQINNLEQSDSNMIKNSRKKSYKKSKFSMRHSMVNRTENNRISSQNIAIKNLKKSEREMSAKSARKYMKKKTNLNINEQLDLLASQYKLMKEKENEEENKNEEEKIDNNNNNDISKKMIKNQKLLYSKKISGYILKIYKAVPKKKNNKKNDDKNEFKKNGKYKKKTKFTIKDYLNNFSPKKYIKKIKNTIKKGNIGNPNYDKKKILDKTLSYLDFYITKNNKNLKKRQDILDKIREKNRHFIYKKRKELIQIIIDELLFKISFKHKSTILKMHLESLLISQLVQFHVHIKLSIMRHVLTNSENDENIYFINLIKHLLYLGKKKITIKYPLIKSYGKMVSPIVERNTTIDKFVNFNKKKIYYLYFCIKYQLFDCETLLENYEDHRFKYLSKKLLKATNNSSLIETQKEDSNSTGNERIKKRQRSKRLTVNKMNNNNNKINFNLKILNLNLTKSIINLGKEKLEEAIRNENAINLKNLQSLYSCKNNNIEFSDSSDSFDFNLYNTKFSNKLLQDKNDALLSHRSIKDNNEEVHQRDRKLLYEYFLSCVEFSLYDKLLHWLKKSCKYMDLNYQLDNGDTLLHLCVRFSVPHYIFRFLVSHGVNINCQNNQGDTALHLAVKDHKYKTIDLLIKLGASEYIINNMNKNCWECL
jgi:hypothetical protein